MEIGSDFCTEEKLKGEVLSEFDNFEFKENTALLFSGRAAIDLVIDDILEKHSIETVYFPEYCCSSMTEAFERHNIRIVFYKVSYNDKKRCLEYDIDTALNCDIFFAMNYFGYHSNCMNKYINVFKARNIFVIEDITHSLLSKVSFCQESDYLVASLRKWFGIYSGGLAIKKSGRFVKKLTDSIIEPPRKIIETKKTAMKLKKAYLNGDVGVSKNEFLEKFKEYNNAVAELNSKIGIDLESYELLKNIDLSEIRKIRIQNAKILENGINSCNARVMFSSEEDDCPIFVPIYIEKKRRFKLLQHFIESQIYTPIHWPMPFSNLSSELYHSEISLICDQRYGQMEMKKIIEVINRFGDA